MKKRWKTVSAPVLCCLLSSIGTPAAGAEAELLLYERNPWLMVIGSDSPLVACYTDGRMIFLDRAASGRSGAVYKSFELDETELAELRSRMKALDALQRHYELSHATDQTTTELAFRSNGNLERISAYGGVPGEMAQFIDFLDAMQTRAAARVESWRPSFIEVMLWPFEYARGQPAPWPNHFPGLDSPSAVKRRESSYSIYLPAAEMENLWIYLEAKQGNAVLLDGEKWTLDLRIPFPHEIPEGLIAPSP